jgi:hypothetical protein
LGCSDPSFPLTTFPKQVGSAPAKECHGMSINECTLWIDGLELDRDRIAALRAANVEQAKGMRGMKGDSHHHLLE